VKSILAGGIMMVVVAVVAAAAYAQGGTPTTSTITFHNDTETVAGFDCEGNPGIETHVFNGVLHVTEFADGHSTTTLTMAGTWSLDLSDPLPDYSGSFVIHETDTVNANLNGVTIAATFIATGTDGSHFRALFQLKLLIVGGRTVVDRIAFSCAQ
jgi:hypothetical protein